MLKIVLLVKTVVPIVSTVKVDERTGSLVREGVPTTLNPWDYAAIELALELRRNYGGHVTAISMAPPFAKEVLEDIVGMGVDDAILVSDRAFAGSDTLATSYVLAETIRKIVKEFDIIIAGQEAADSVTSHVPAQVAAFLNVPYVYYVTSVKHCNVVDRVIRLERFIEDEGRAEEFEIDMPVVISVYRRQTYLPVSVLRKISARLEGKVRIVSNKELQLDPSKIGLAGSPTRVSKVENFRIASKNVQFLDFKTPDEAARWILDLVRKYMQTSKQ